ncbi:hypothetical protein [uncultured Aeromicrobium sp.]|uniref:hypothetical protein n=1 Tax=uncultured Aeromicrobium sp. TaxID=337820 RepID=UPI0025E50262|nr:hypothetical protein [uncultured Aeromicrobium sp.]
MSSDSDRPTYYYCFKHQAVEGEDGCRGADRMGPYGTPEEAARALEIAQARNEAWDNDPAWNDPED